MSDPHPHVNPWLIAVVVSTVFFQGETRMRTGVEPLTICQMPITSVPVSSTFFPTWGLRAVGLAISRYV